MQELAESTEEAGRENLYFVQSTGAIADASSLSNMQLELAADFLKDQQGQTRRLVQDNFGLVASHTSLQHALSLTNDQLARQADI